MHRGREVEQIWNVGWRQDEELDGPAGVRVAEGAEREQAFSVVVTKRLRLDNL